VSGIENADQRNKMEEDIKKFRPIAQNISLYLFVPLSLVLIVVGLYSFVVEGGSSVLYWVVFRPISMMIVFVLAALVYCTYKTGEREMMWVHASLGITYLVLGVLYIFSPIPEQPIGLLSPPVVVETLYANGSALLSNGTLIQFILAQ